MYQDIHLQCSKLYMSSCLPTSHDHQYVDLNISLHVLCKKSMFLNE